MKSLRVIAAAAPLLLAVACGSDISEGSPDATVDDGFETLVEMDWEVPAGSQAYYCVRKTLEEDLHVGAFEALAPPGTHHTVLSVGPPTGPDGTRSCGSYDHNFNALIFESSSGTDRFELPDGLATRIPAGQQVNFNLHILNATDETLSGTSGARIARRDAAEVEELATAVYMGKLTLDIPPGESTHVGHCDVSEDITLFGVLPHMHSFGRHMKVVAKSSIVGDTVVHDQSFLFDTTKAYVPFDPVPMAKGDRVEVHCSYENTTGETLRWGQDSYTAEMCFAAVYLFPADGQSSACAQ